ncbi:hypothetical protein HAX54_034017 [Datura stramonium]|uniref:Uncharacterized protein n=1 Tax=Datura stramonium TaxID=4076 RepID=A0ABS8VDA6_DATST|nr:hypothetical protein [Datura stramonium]
MLLGSERKLVMLSATGLSQSRVQHSRLLRLAATLVLLFNNPIFTVVSCLPMDSAAVRVALFGNLGSYLFSTPKHFVDYYALPHLWVPRYPPVLWSVRDPWMQGVLGVISVEGEIVHQAVLRKGQLRSSSPEISDEGTLGEPPTPTTIYVRSILDPDQLPIPTSSTVLDSPSLSQ